MENKGKITVHIDQPHTCGQVHEMIYHLQDGNVNFPIEFPPILPVHIGDFASHAEEEGKLEFSGTYSKVELNGVKFEDKKITCAKCGENILFPFWFYEIPDEAEE